MAGALSLSQTDPSESLDQIPQLLDRLAPRDESNKWLAFTAGMGAPTKTGALSEALGNAATMQLEQRNQHDRLKAAYMPLIANVFEAQQKAKQAQELNKMLSEFMGPSVSPGAYAPAADGYGPTMPQPQVGSRLAGMTPDQVAMLKLRGLDVTDMYKWARDPQKMDQGATYVDKTTGETKFMPKVPEGARLTATGGIEAVPGFLPFQSQQTLATELPKAVVGSAGRVNLRKMPDGTEAPVVELSENPMLNNYLASLSGTPGAMPPTPRATPGAPTARPGQPPAAPRPAMTQPGDNDRAQILNSELVAANGRLQSAKTPDEQRRAQADIDALGREMQASGIKPGAGYGKTTAQTTAEEVEKTKQLEQVKADVKPTAARENAIAAAGYLNNLVGRAIAHPGRETATGLSGSIDPRNVLPGTKAKDFRVMLDQIKGAAFLQAFESLKGGGAITEMEGQAATKAIARLDTAQSDDAFKAALEEFQEVTKKGADRLKKGIVVPPVGAVMDGFTYNGGDPADPKSWERK